MALHVNTATEQQTDVCLLPSGHVKVLRNINKSASFVKHLQNQRSTSLVNRSKRNDTSKSEARISSAEIILSKANMQNQ